MAATASASSTAAAYESTYGKLNLPTAASVGFIYDQHGRPIQQEHYAHTPSSHYPRDGAAGETRIGESAFESGRAEAEKPLTLQFAQWYHRPEPYTGARRNNTFNNNSNNNEDDEDNDDEAGASAEEKEMRILFGPEVLDQTHLNKSQKNDASTTGIHYMSRLVAPRIDAVSTANYYASCVEETLRNRCCCFTDGGDHRVSNININNNNNATTLSLGSSGGGGSGGGRRRRYRPPSLDDGAEAALVMERQLWDLCRDIFSDAKLEITEKYNAGAIGLRALPPHRRWYVSQHAVLQELLMRHPTLRRAAIILRWLERTYREEGELASGGGGGGGGFDGGDGDNHVGSGSAASLLYHGHKNTAAAGNSGNANFPFNPVGNRSSSSIRLLHGEDRTLLRQPLLSAVRGGQHSEAIRLAAQQRDCAYTCVLSAAQLQTVPEPWEAHTYTAPLFGEYAQGELRQQWTGNEHRFDNLCQLFEETRYALNNHNNNNNNGGAQQQQQRQSRNTFGGGGGDGDNSNNNNNSNEGTGFFGGANNSNNNNNNNSGATGRSNAGGAAEEDEGARRSYDAVIAAALCGRLEVLESAFLRNGTWRDIVWCYLRCALVLAFSKTIMHWRQGCGGNSNSSNSNNSGNRYSAGAGGGLWGTPSTSNNDNNNNAAAHGPASYEDYLYRQLGSQDDWVERLTARLSSELQARLSHFESAQPDSFSLAELPFVDQLQMRLILLLLKPNGGALGGASSVGINHNHTNDTCTNNNNSYASGAPLSNPFVSPQQQQQQWGGGANAAVGGVEEAEEEDQMDWPLLLQMTSSPERMVRLQRHNALPMHSSRVAAATAASSSFFDGGHGFSFGVSGLHRPHRVADINNNNISGGNGGGALATASYMNQHGAGFSPPSSSSSPFSAHAALAEPPTHHGARLLTHVMLLLRQAYAERLLGYAVDVRAARVMGDALALTAHHLALLPRLRFEGGMRITASLAAHALPALPELRAEVYAAFVLAVRQHEVARAAPAGSGGGLSRAEMEEQEAQLVEVFVTRELRTEAQASGGGGFGQHQHATTTNTTSNSISNPAGFFGGGFGNNNNSNVSRHHGASSSSSSFGGAAAAARRRCLSAVQRLLDTHIAAAEELLTHERGAEAVLWAAMHIADPLDAAAALRMAVETCAAYWIAATTTSTSVTTSASATTSNALQAQAPQEEPRVLAAAPEPLPLEALGDVTRVCLSRILRRLPPAAAPPAGNRSDNSNGGGLGESVEIDRQLISAWYVLAEARDLVKEHASLCAQLAAAALHASSSSSFSSSSSSSSVAAATRLLAAAEANKLREVLARAAEAADACGLAYRHLPEMLSAIAWCAAEAAAAAALSLSLALPPTAVTKTNNNNNSNSNNADEAGAGLTPPLATLQAVYALVERLSRSGLFAVSAQLLPAHPWLSTLYAQVRAARVAYGRRQHRDRVAAALAVAAASATNA